MLQAYSALPFNITSGVTTMQGTAGRPIVNGAFIERNAGVGSDFFSLNAAREPLVQARTGACGSKALAEAFNLTNRRNDLTRNANFGAGAYPASPASTFGQIMAVGDPQIGPVFPSIEVLMSAAALGLGMVPIACAILMSCSQPVPAPGGSTAPSTGGTAPESALPT